MIQLDGGSKGDAMTVKIETCASRVVLCAAIGTLSLIASCPAFAADFTAIEAYDSYAVTLSSPSSTIPDNTDCGPVNVFAGRVHWQV
jgi:hypothetical protein